MKMPPFSGTYEYVYDFRILNPNAYLKETLKNIIPPISSSRYAAVCAPCLWQRPSPEQEPSGIILQGGGRGMEGAGDLGKGPMFRIRKLKK